MSEQMTEEEIAAIEARAAIRAASYSEVAGPHTRALDMESAADVPRLCAALREAQREQRDAAALRESAEVSAIKAMRERDDANARAEKAEKIAAAERALRMAQRAWDDMRRNGSPVGDTYTNLENARAALRALGVDP